MTAVQIEGAGLSLTGIPAYNVDSRSTDLINGDLLQVRPSLIRRALGRWLRQIYGIYKLTTAPRQAFYLITAQPDTALGKFVEGAGRISALAAQPFVCAEWLSAMRLRRMIDHCVIIDKLGHPFDVSGDQYVQILSFDLDGQHCRLTLDQPNWLSSDGMLCVSLWTDCDRIFSSSFCLADSATGRTAYIGGIQGRRSEHALDQNRILTKAAHGMRPRDLCLELSRMLMPYLGVTQMKGVADASRYQLTKRAMLTIGANDKVLLDYDEIWESRGGVPEPGGFFVIPVASSRRDVSDIPAKKRSMYKRRYALLDEYQAEIASAMQTKLPIHTHCSDLGAVRLKLPRG